MPPEQWYSQAPADSRRRGLPAIGFRVRIPDGVRSIPTDLVVADRGFLLRCEERASDGRLVGEMELGVFGAGLIVDRDGVLEDLVVAAAERAIDVARAGRIVAIVPVELDGGASGYRAEVELLRATRAAERIACPHVTTMAFAPADLGVCGGVLCTTRAALPEWPAADAMLASLRILTTRASGPANDEAARAHLPFVKRR